MWLRLSCFPTSRVDRGDHYSWFPFVPPSQNQLSTIPPRPLLSPLKPKLLIPNLFWKTLPILNQCTSIPSLSSLQLLYQRDTSIKPVSEDVMTFIEIFFRNSHHNLGRDREISSAVRKICSLITYIQHSKNLVTIYILHSTLHLSYTKTYICYMVTLTTVNTSLTPTTTPTYTNIYKQLTFERRSRSAAVPQRQRNLSRSPPK